MRHRAHLLFLIALALAALACGAAGAAQPAQPVGQQVAPSPTPPPIPTRPPLTPTPAGWVVEQPTEVPQAMEGTASLIYSANTGGQLSLYLMPPTGGMVSRVEVPSEVRHAVWPTLSPDGTRLAFVSVAGSVSLRSNGIYVMELDGSGLTQITFGDGTHPQWSPDSARLAFTCNSGTDVCVINADGSGLVNLTGEDEFIDRYPSWTLDGRIVFMSNRDTDPDTLAAEIYIMGDDGTAVTRLTADETAYNAHPRVSPDGLLIAYESDRDVESGSELYVMALDGSGQRRITTDGLWNQTPVWRPDGNALIFAAPSTDGGIDLYSIPLDEVTPPTRLTASPGEDGGLRFGQDAVRANVPRVFIAEQTRLPELALPRGSQLAGNPILFAASNFNCSGCLGTGIYRVNFDGSNLSQLPLEGLYPAWSPDFRHIIFTRDGELYIANSNGTEPTQVTRSMAGLTAPLWHSGYDEVVADCVPYGQHDVCLVDMKTGVVRNLTPEINGGPSAPFPGWYFDNILVGTQVINRDGQPVASVPGAGRVSPNGRFLAATIDRQVAVISLDTGAAAVLTSDNAIKGFPVWSPDGEFLVYTNAPGDGRLYLNVMRRDGTGGQVITPPIAAGPESLPADLTVYLGYNWAP
ncbi:MAG: hypothetical protein Kow00124_18780 [Anaerolineae bacterium]